MTAPKRAWIKSRTSVRVTDKELQQAEVLFPDGTHVWAWLVGGVVRILEGDVLTKDETEILEEKVRTAFPEHEQKALFG